MSLSEEERSIMVESEIDRAHRLMIVERLLNQ